MHLQLAIEGGVAKSKKLTSVIFLREQIVRMYSGIILLELFLRLASAADGGREEQRMSEAITRNTHNSGSWWMSRYTSWRKGKKHFKYSLQTYLQSGAHDFNSLFPTVSCLLTNCSDWLDTSHCRFTQSPIPSFTRFSNRCSPIIRSHNYCRHEYYANLYRESLFRSRKAAQI